jgi:hypothetical protein
VRAASKIVAGAVAASVGAIVLTGTPAAASPTTGRAVAVRTAVLQLDSVRVQTVDNTANAKQLEAQTDQLNKILQTLIADTGFGTAPTNIPKAKLTTLLVNMITQHDPSIAPDVAMKAAAALGDLVNLAMALDTSQIAKVAEEAGPFAAAVTQIAGQVATGQGPSPDAIGKLISSGGAAGTALLSLLITGLTAYEASTNLPQLTDLLDVIDPLATDGSKVFDALPAQVRTPEVEAALHLVADFGRTLASIDLIKILKVVQHFTALLPQS